jgi:hypothetical protein
VCVCVCVCVCGRSLAGTLCGLSFLSFFCFFWLGSGVADVHMRVSGGKGGGWSLIFFFCGRAVERELTQLKRMFGL